ncbi:Dehydrogenase orf1 [Exophiala dermatitidis]|uniref:Oxidoreductase n=1 Tax=Exophiala dermatitidis (strain ATCC 34100 / CBS 525.76 / NIH/UT8656) TaxID=858893 RepID=H6BNB7_EXODN|nr:oxidoreductase [Exophiala dermatitidis NIH/UT8656]EHY53186.1 oxidoreductase [Exophiala dermatitidis NIH/UT8656]
MSSLTPTPTNHAAWLPTRQSPTMVVDVAPYTAPETDELVIRARAVAINPADVAIQAKGLLLASDDDYPAILGCDVAGDVVEVHSSLAHAFSTGDRVIGQASPLRTKRKENDKKLYCYSAFQEYVVLKVPFVTKIPASTKLEDATVLPLAVNTSATCLFAPECLGLRLPSGNRTQESPAKEEETETETLLVWGASSSVGSCGVQLATLAGYEVIGVASKKNHDMVRSLGAKLCFDHHDPKMIDDIVRNLQGKRLVGAFDAISTDDTLAAVCDILDRSEGRKLVAAVMPGAEAKATKGVRITTNFAAAANAVTGGLGKSVWTWLGKALDEDRIKCMPLAHVVGHGLQDIQKAVDFLAQGVSAKKLVVEI